MPLSVESPSDEPLKRNSYIEGGTLSALQKNVTEEPSIAVFSVVLVLKTVPCGLSDVKQSRKPLLARLFSNVAQRLTGSFIR